VHLTPGAIRWSLEKFGGINLEHAGEFTNELQANVA
jgi:hypothetical protein